MRLFRLSTVFVLVAVVLVSMGTVLVQGEGTNPTTALPVTVGEEYNATRALPATVEQGATFDVTVNFTVLEGNFTIPGITDFAPDGWSVAVNRAWCGDPEPTYLGATDNMAEYGWAEEEKWFNKTELLTALYKVTVPCNATPGEYYPFDGYIGYWVEGCSTHIFRDITGDTQVWLTTPAICFTESIDFWVSPGGTKSETLQLWSSTPCTLNWDSSNVTYDPNGNMSWLTQNITSGSCTDVSVPVALSVNSSSMPVGDYSANITINATTEETGNLTSNSPQKVPVGLHIRKAGSLKGEVSFTGRGTNNSRWNETFEVRFFEHGNLTNELWRDNATTNNTGVFIMPEVFIGTYDIGIKNWTCLSVLNTSVVVTENCTKVVEFGTPLEGDSSHYPILGYDRITYDDYMDIVYYYMSTSFPHGDFNRNGMVDYDDYMEILYSYGKKGDLYGK